VNRWTTVSETFEMEMLRFHGIQSGAMRRSIWVIVGEASLSATATCICSRADHPPSSNHRHLYPLSPLRQGKMRRTVGENGSIADGSSRGPYGIPVESRMTWVDREMHAKFSEVFSYP